MKQQIAKIFALMTISSLALAQESPPQLVLDKISFQVASRQWVSTQTALLQVSVNVTLNHADLVKARADIMDSLAKIAQGEWHLLEFDRSQDSSGLEKLTVVAQARVDQAKLTDVYRNAKTVSMPGAKYDVSAIEFKPSLEETQAVRSKIRETLYQQVNDELARMNKAYPGQHYSVSHLAFVEGEIPQQPKAYQAKELNAMVLAGSSAPALTVSNELLMTAFVEAASNRK